MYLKRDREAKQSKNGQLRFLMTFKHVPTYMYKNIIMSIVDEIKYRKPSSIKSCSIRMKSPLEI